ncbi:hypothetical protein [Parafrankia sp. EUN1f]|uniref:hypothetical protein n=1 Tax=Parafrankia sp. EUN1f TaxID=102897 RepID=UPI0012F9DCAC|nr:hypothetical protein [Parafrankia sp. EUN1f]
MLALDERLRDHVQNRLDAKDSFEQVSRRLVVLFPDDPHMRVSHETIYRSLYMPGRGGLRRELVQRLRTGRTLRKTRRTTEREGASLAWSASRSDRPRSWTAPCRDIGKATSSPVRRTGPRSARSWSV